MNKKELLNKLTNFFDMDKKKRKKNAIELKKLLKALKNEEKKLINKSHLELSSAKQKMIIREVTILHAKRKKGLKALKKMMIS
jgi:hypothetical protein